MPNANLFARALFALHEANVLREPACKAAVKMFIRQASKDEHWHLSAHYRSRAAAQKIQGANIRTRAQYQSFCRASENSIRHEHMVPGEAVYKMLLALPTMSVQAIEDLVLRTALRATITEDEDRRLPRDTMPAEYYDPESPLYQNPLARYIVTGIVGDLEQRPDAGWFPGEAPLQGLPPASRARRA